MKLWKNNQIDEEYELHPSMILDNFLQSKFFNTWINHKTTLSLSDMFSKFLTSKEGLNSSAGNNFIRLLNYILDNWEDRSKQKMILGMMLKH
jgi:nucleoid-associated protein YejK